MALLQPVAAGTSYLKAGFLGFPKAGKTYTATLLAIATRQSFGLTGPIAFFDTEGGSTYVAALVRALTGTELIGIKSRSLDDLSATVDECIAVGASVLLAESMTHIWRELCDSYLLEVNAARKRRMGGKFFARQGLEFQDWAPLKKIWNERWADRYLNAPLHIIIAGRAGFEYDMEENEETHKKELTKTGIKMKTEGEFGFEPSLLVQMDREQVPDGKGGFRIFRRATVIGDRFGVIDGRSVELAETDQAAALAQVADFFSPHLALLNPLGATPINVTPRTKTGADEDGDTEWARERKTRAILCEEIQGELVNAHPGQTAVEKKAKTDLIYDAFQTRSWTAVESMESGKLRAGLAEIRSKLRPEAPPETPAADENDPAPALRQQIADRREQLRLSEPEFFRLAKEHAGTTVIDVADPAALTALLEALRKK